MCKRFYAFRAHPIRFKNQIFPLHSLAFTAYQNDFKKDLSDHIVHYIFSLFLVSTDTERFLSSWVTHGRWLQSCLCLSSSDVCPWCAWIVCSVTFSGLQSMRVEPEASECRWSCSFHSVTQSRLREEKDKTENQSITDALEKQRRTWHENLVFHLKR